MSTLRHQRAPLERARQRGRSCMLSGRKVFLFALEIVGCFGGWSAPRIIRSPPLDFPGGLPVGRGGGVPFSKSFGTQYWPTDVFSNTIWTFTPTTTEKSSETPTSKRRTCKSTGAYCATSQNIYSIPTLHSDTTLSCQEYPPGSLTLKNGQAQAYTRTREHSFSVLLFPHPGTPANPTSSPQEPRPLASSQS